MISKIKEYYKNNGFANTTKFIISSLCSRIVRKKNYYKSINSKAGNIKHYDKNKRKVFMFASVPFFDVGGGQRSASLSREFKKIGYNVIYIYAFPTSESKIYNLVYPTIIHTYVNKFDIKKFRQLINKDDIVIFEVPSNKYLPYLNEAKGRCKVIYENIDNWLDKLGNAFFEETTLREFLESSDLLTATAKLLELQLKEFLDKYKISKDILYLPNAVNDEMFNSKLDYEKPRDLVVGRKTLLYYGSLWLDCFDWDLIINVAKSNKEYEINLIGDDKFISIKKNKLPKNIRFLGPKRQRDLPSYLAHSDFALYPFKIDQTGLYVSPLKVFEYISMQKKVLATCSEEIKNFPGVFRSNDYKEWIKAIESDEYVSKKKQEEFIRRNNWFNRCNELLKKIGSDE